LGWSCGRIVAARACRAPRAEIASDAAHVRIGDARAAQRVRCMTRDRSAGRSRVERLENRAGGAGIRAGVENRSDGRGRTKIVRIDESIREIAPGASTREGADWR
jgi:hypothetical protein